MRIRYVDPEVLGGVAASHALVRMTKHLGIPHDEVWIASDLRSIAPVLKFHEEVEYWMELDGMQHAAAHRKAMVLEREMFEGTAVYARAKRLLKAR